MNNGKKRSVEDLQVISLLSGLVVIVCAVMIILEGKAIQLYLSVMAAVGAIMNLAIAAIKFIRNGKKQGFCFVLMAILLLGAFVMLQIYK